MKEVSDEASRLANPGSYDCIGTEKVRPGYFSHFDISIGLSAGSKAVPSLQFSTTCHQCISTFNCVLGTETQDRVRLGLPVTSSWARLRS